MMKKNGLLLLAMTFCLLACAGCSGQASESVVDTTATDVSVSQRNTEGTALSDSDVTLELAADETEVQVTQDYLITNTGEITVSADDIPDGVEIQLYLYTKTTDGDEPIMYATLTDSETSFVFSGLTSAQSYKVGAETDTLAESLTLTITD